MIKIELLPLGLEAEWNGVATTKILIPGFRWQLLYDEQARDIRNYEDVVALMTS